MSNTKINLYRQLRSKPTAEGISDCVRPYTIAISSMSMSSWIKSFGMISVLIPPDGWTPESHVGSTSTGDFGVGHHAVAILFDHTTRLKS